MYLLLQLPLADSRIFLPATQTQQLPVPEWPAPTPDTEFVRFFGGVKIRKRGGVAGLGGEDTICEAKRAVRFAHSPVYKDASSALKMAFRTYRRFYFDGYVVGKFEVSLANLCARFQELNLSAEQTRQIIRYFLGLDVFVRATETPATEQKPIPLAQIGKHLAQLYFTASSASELAPDSDQWWVRPGAPLLFLEYNQRRREHVEFPSHRKSVTLPAEYGLELSYGFVPYQGRDIRMWMLGFDAGSVDVQKARSLRLCLLRLHAEHECLRLILNNIKRQRIAVTPRSAQSEVLQQYLRDATTAINNLETRSTKQFDADIVAIARQSMNSLTPGDHEEIVKRLQTFDIRKNLLRNVETYITRDGQRAQENMQEQYNLLSDKVNTLRKALIIENDPATRFKLEHQVAEAETDLQKLEHQLETLEHTTPLIA